ncbi:MAG: hypothetical protein AAF311_07080 [Pseudomonadota bacterium]
MAIEKARTRITALAGPATILAGLFMAGSAWAGPVFHCGAPGGPVCDAGVEVLPAPRPHHGPATVQNRTPYDFLDSIHFQRSPHVSITRIHGMGTTVGLSDAPKGFTGGCHPESTAYCRSAAPTPPLVAPPVIPRPPVIAPPVIAPPVIRPPAPCGRPVAPAPCGQAYSGRVVAVGRVSPPSAFVPRIYGDPHTIVPGIAHVPTSIVDRDPYRAQALLDTRQPRPNPWTPGGVTPALTGVPVQPHVPGPALHPGPVPHPGRAVTGRYGLAGPGPVCRAPRPGHPSSCGRY